MQNFQHGLQRGNLEEALQEHWCQYVPAVFIGQMDAESGREERRAKRLLFRPMETFLCQGEPESVLKQLKRIGSTIANMWTSVQDGRANVFLQVFCFIVSYVFFTNDCQIAKKRLFTLLAGNNPILVLLLSK